MVTYPHVHHLHLSPLQHKKLLQGHTIRVPHRALHGSGHLAGKHLRPVHMSHTQMRHLHNAHALKKGMKLHFSAHQAKHHLRHGGGFWDRLKNGLVSAGKWALGNIVKPAASAALGALGQSGNPIISGLSGIVRQHTGLGLRRAPTRRRRVGLGGMHLAVQRRARVGTGVRRVGVRRRRVGVSRVGGMLGGELSMVY
jgi:hypothetical protein